MKSYWGSLCVGLFLLLSVQGAIAQADRIDQARRHMVRGSAAVEVAIASKSQSDLKDAAQEFRKATELAPEFALAWFNLGAVEAKLGRYAEAISAYQRYLKLSPKAEDVQKVQDEIVKLEFRQEKADKRQRIAGTWVTFRPVKLVSGEGEYSYFSSYNASLDGDIVRLKVSDARWSQRETVVSSASAYDGFRRDYPWGWANAVNSVTLEFVGRLEGERIVGERVRSGFSDKTTTCRVEEHRAPFEGRLEDDGKTLVISVKEPRYSLLWDYVSLFDATTICSRVIPEQPEQMEFRLTQSTGNVGVLEVTQESKGKPWKVAKILGAEMVDSSGYRRVWSGAENVGIKEGDEIQAINGRETRTMYRGEVLDQLNGSIGQLVRITLNRAGWNSPVDLTLVCGAVPLPEGKPFGKGMVGMQLDMEMMSIRGTPAWRYRVGKVIAGGAAEAAGVKTGGEILAIDDKELRNRPYQAMRALLRGEPGVEVKLSIQYPDGSQIDHNLTRQEEKPENK